jgi:hypothetical protein
MVPRLGHNTGSNPVCAGRCAGLAGATGLACLPAAAASLCRSPTSSPSARSGWPARRSTSTSPRCASRRGFHSRKCGRPRRRGEGGEPRGAARAQHPSVVGGPPSVPHRRRRTSFPRAIPPSHGASSTRAKTPFARGCQLQLTSRSLSQPLASATTHQTRAATAPVAASQSERNRVETVARSAAPNRMLASVASPMLSVLALRELRRRTLGGASLELRSPHGSP